MSVKWSMRIMKNKYMKGWLGYNPHLPQSPLWSPILPSFALPSALVCPPHTRPYRPGDWTDWRTPLWYGYGRSHLFGNTKTHSTVILLYLTLFLCSCRACVAGLWGDCSIYSQRDCDCICCGGLLTWIDAGIADFYSVYCISHCLCGLIALDDV